MLTKWETIFLLLMTLPIMGHVVILPLMLDVAGRDAWISIFLSLPAAFFFAYAIYRLKLKYPNEDVVGLLHLLMGKFFGSIMIIVFMFYFLFLTILSFASLVDFVYISFLPETPRLAITIWFFLFFIFAAVKGIKRIALTSGILTFITMITGHSITLMDTPKKDWTNLLPMLEFGWSPVFLGAVILISIWIELLLLLCLPIQNIRAKHLFLIWIIGILFNAIMMFSTITGVITIFGLGPADNFIYPALEIVRIINLGFIDRFDVYGMILMLFGTYIRCSLYLRISFNIASTKISTKWLRRSLFACFIFLVFLGTNYLTKEHFRLDEAIRVYTFMIILFPLPFLLLGISYVKGKMKRGSQEKEISE